jgi:hypothetical protein
MLAWLVRYRSVWVFLVAFLAASEFLSHYTQMDDEAVLVYGAQRMLEGEKIYRDWDTHLAPGSFCLTALWSSVLGISLPFPRLLAALVAASMGLTIDLAARRLFTGWWSLMPALLWCCDGIMEFPILSYHWMATAWISAALAVGLGWLEQPSRNRALLLGGCIASAGWTLQSEGLVGVLMLAFWMGRFRPAGSSWVLISLVVSSFLLWLPNLPEWPQILRQNLDLGHHLAFNQNRYSLHNLQNFLSHYQGLSPSLGLGVYLGAGSHIVVNILRYLGLPLLTLTCIGLCEWRKDRLGAALGYAMLAWLLGTANRHTAVYLSFLNPGWFLLLSRCLWQIPGVARWGLGLALLEVVGWGARYTLRAKSYIYPITCRQGIYTSNDPNEAASTQQLLQWLADLPPQTPVLCFPYATRLYPMAQLKNPIRRQTLVPHLEPDGAAQQARQQIEKQQTDWLVYVGPDPLEIEADYGIPAAQVKSDWDQLRKQMTQGYVQVQGGDHMGLYRRISP